MGACARLALEPLGLGGTGGLRVVSVLDNLGHKAVLPHQLESHLVASLYFVCLSK